MVGEAALNGAGLIGRFTSLLSQTESELANRMGRGWMRVRYGGPIIVGAE